MIRLEIIIAFFFIHFFNIDLIKIIKI